MSDYRRFKVKRGVHVSSKCVGGSFKFRSALEEKYAKQLDADDDVLSYSYERVVIPYVVNDKQHMYHVDLVVQRRDVCCLVEVKYSTYVSDEVNVVKFDAARSWCKDNACEFVVITEKDIKKCKP